jgi:hypothetical protein
VEAFKQQREALLAVPKWPAITEDAKRRINATVVLLNAFIKEEGDEEPSTPMHRFPVRVDLQSTLMFQLPAAPSKDVVSHADFTNYCSELRDKTHIDPSEEMKWAPVLDKEGEQTTLSELSPQELAWRAYHIVVARLFSYGYTAPGRVQGFFLHMAQYELNTYAKACSWSETIGSQNNTEKKDAPPTAAAMPASGAAQSTAAAMSTAPPMERESPVVFAISPQQRAGQQQQRHGGTACGSPMDQQQCER